MLKCLNMDTCKFSITECIWAPIIIFFYNCVPDYKALHDFVRKY
jgi:hypothetical protein